MDSIELTIKICGAITAIAAAIVVLRKLIYWLKPCVVEISYTIRCNQESKDELSVGVTNKSNAPVYVKTCTVRSTYSMLDIIKLHVKHPLLHPRLYQNLRYNGAVYQFVDDLPVKIDPSQFHVFKKQIYEHPLNAIYGPLIVAKIKLTTGQIIRSKKLKSPMVWRFIGERGKIHA